MNNRRRLRVMVAVLCAGFLMAAGCSSGDSANDEALIAKAAETYSDQLFNGDLNKAWDLRDAKSKKCNQELFKVGSMFIRERMAQAHIPTTVDRIEEIAITDDHATAAVYLTGDSSPSRINLTKEGGKWLIHIPCN